MESLFNITNSGIFDSKLAFLNMRTTPKRKVSFFEIEYFLSNEGIAYINGEQYEIKKGQVLIAKPGQIRYSSLPYKCYYLYLEPNEEISRYLANTPNMFSSIHFSDYRRLLNKIILEIKSPSNFSGLLISSMLYELLYILKNDHAVEDHQSLIQYSYNKRVILTAIAYLNENFQKKINLDNLASEVSLSKAHFHRLFSNAVGMTPQQYLLHLRMNHAKNLLLTSDDSLIDIAYDSGFSSQSYFNFIFKKEQGITPKKFQSQKYTKELL